MIAYKAKWKTKKKKKKKKKKMKRVGFAIGKEWWCKQM